MLLWLLLSLPAAAEHLRWSVTDPDRDKVIPVDVYVPEGEGPFPVIMLSHGFHGNPGNMSWLIDALVSRGYLVAGPTHADPNRDNVHMNHWNRALDVSRALTAVLDSDLPVDEGRIGMAGFSLGGGTGIWLAGGRATLYRRTANPGPEYAPQDEFFPVGSPQYEALMQDTDFEVAARSYRDERITRFFLMAPSLGWAFDAESLGAIDVPVSIAVGSSDELLVPSGNALYYAAEIPQCRLHLIPGAGHYVFLDEGLESDPPGIDRRAVHAQVIGFFWGNAGGCAPARSPSTASIR